MFIFVDIRCCSDKPGLTRCGRWQGEGDGCSIVVLLSTLATSHSQETWLNEIKSEEVRYLTGDVTHTVEVSVGQCRITLCV